MKKVVGLLLTLDWSCTAAAQTSPPPSDLRQLVEAMQKVLKPSVGQPLPPRSISASASVPIPLLLNGSTVPLDSLNRYKLDQVASVTLVKDIAHTAIYGVSGSWGVIEVKLKKASQ